MIAEGVSKQHAIPQGRNVTARDAHGETGLCTAPLLQVYEQVRHSYFKDPQETCSQKQKLMCKFAIMTNCVFISSNHAGGRFHF